MKLTVVSSALCCRWASLLLLSCVMQAPSQAQQFIVPEPPVGPVASPPALTPSAPAAPGRLTPAPELAEHWADTSSAAPSVAHANSRAISPSDPPVAPPTGAELVSVLKRNLPAESQPVEMRDAPEWFQNMIQQIVRDNIPAKYVRDKDWGKKTRRWDGIKLRRRGALGLSTKRKWKEVNHGTWKRYEITPVDPQQQLKMRIENVHDAGKGRVAFELYLETDLHVYGRLAKWAKGVKLYSVSAEADATVLLRLWCQVGTRLDIRKFPPDILMVPEVTRSDLQVPKFQLQRVSRMDGPVVRSLSDNVHDFLLEKLDEKRDQLPAKINRQIAKNQDKMRLSLADFASDRWDALSGSGAATDSDASDAAREKDAASVPIGETAATTRTKSTDRFPLPSSDRASSVARRESPASTAPAPASRDQDPDERLDHGQPLLLAAPDNDDAAKHESPTAGGLLNLVPADR